MTDALEQLVQETVELTGVTPPDLLAGDAPVLSDEAIEGASGDFYLVGLIGGKDVGKSAMVNALAGRVITQTTSHGAGTNSVVAYVHASRADAVRQLLDREAAGQYRIVSHDYAQLARQVLVDLPDIDSHWEAHLALTRRMLRHLLFPIWIVSVEKYADRLPQQMLDKVAAGNAPQNFVFVLNKIDQLGTEAVRAAKEIRDDYAKRVAATLGTEPPRVWMVSALRPDQFDLPALRQSLSQQRSEKAVEESRQLAHLQQGKSLVRWLDGQNLPERADRLHRLERDAHEMLTARVAAPLLEVAVGRIMDDPSLRATILEDALHQRVTRWPLVNLVHTLLAPVLGMASAFVRGQTPAASGDPAILVETHLRMNGRGVAPLVQTTFAQLRQTHPQLATMYGQRRLWEDMPADLASQELRVALATAVERQRGRVMQAAGGSNNAIAEFGRWLVTIGALLWFPIAQPLLEAWLQPGFTRTTQELLLLAVQVFGATYLLKNAGFLLVYFLVLWLAIRWDTQRRVNRSLVAWGRETASADADLAGVILTWLDRLLEPITRTYAKLQDLSQRAQNARTLLAK